jgi:dipeptidyl aminopeptidase/acylaminoacyl peptidase
MTDRDTRPPLIPLETLFGNPDRMDPRISPDGRHLSSIAPLDGVLNVWVEDLAEGGEPRPITRDDGRGIRHHGWAYGHDLVLYVQDRDGDENWKIFAVPAAGGEPRELTPDVPDVEHPVQAQLLGLSHRRPGEALVGLNRRDPRIHDVHHLDLATGELSLIEEGDVLNIGWLVDHDLHVRGYHRTDPSSGAVTVLLRDGASGPLRELLTWSPEDALSSHVLDFDATGGKVRLLDARGRNAAALVEIDLASGGQRVIAADEFYDVARVETHPTTQEIQAVAFERDRRVWLAVDDSIAEDLDALVEADRGDLGLVDRTLDDRTWIVGYNHDDGPVAFARYDREAKAVTPLFVHREALVGLPLAKMEPISYTARDGLAIHGYLTRPPGVEPPHPLVLDVHGGPWHRDQWGFDPEAQWLANRGYACLQVNYRGSTGYGKAFLNAGDREWGGKMQDDLTDAVRWAVAQGIADEQRVVIFGGSYGGYAALAGVTFTPQLYRAGVSIVGPSNLVTFLDTVPPYWESFRAMLDARVGRIPRYADGERAGMPKDEADWTEEERREIEFLRSRSPLVHVDAVRVPMLVAQGANDPRVVKAESDHFVEAMRAKKLAVDYVVYEDEGHGFARPENRLDFYERAERFLAEHLG